MKLHLQLPGCRSLKDKRSRLKPILARLQKEFNISVAEMDHLDAWQDTAIACVCVSNEPIQVERTLQQVIHFTEEHWPDCPILDEQLEVIPWT